MAKCVYVVTHGDKHKGSNPCMTNEGIEQVEALKGLIPSEPPVIVIGTGNRHLDVACALGLAEPSDPMDETSRITSRFPLRFTPVVGGPESLEKVNGEDYVVLADGTLVPFDQYTGTEDGKASMVQLVLSLPDKAVVCAGRPSMILLDKADAKSAAVYRINLGTVHGEPLMAIEEIVAHGVSEQGTV